MEKSLQVKKLSALIASHQLGNTDEKLDRCHCLIFLPKRQNDVAYHPGPEMPFAGHLDYH